MPYFTCTDETILEAPMTGFWRRAAEWLSTPVPGAAADGGRIGVALSAAQRAQVRATIGDIEDFLRAHAPVVTETGADAGADPGGTPAARPRRARRRRVRTVTWRTESRRTRRRG